MHAGTYSSRFRVTKKVEQEQEMKGKHNFFPPSMSLYASIFWKFNGKNLVVVFYTE